MSWCPLCGKGHGNGGDPCRECEDREAAFERGEIDEDGKPVNDLSFLPTTTTTGSGEDLTHHNRLCHHPSSIKETTLHRAPETVQSMPTSSSPSGCLAHDGVGGQL